MRTALTGYLKPKEKRENKRPPHHGDTVITGVTGRLTGGKNFLTVTTLPDIRGHHVLVRSDSRSVMSCINLHVSEQLLCVDQSALTEGDACVGQNEPRSRHVTEQCLRGMDAPPALGSENLESLWQSSSRPLCLRRQLSLPNLFHKEHGCPGPRVAQSYALCFPSNCSATAGTQANQGAQAYSNSPSLEEPAVGVGVIPAARSSPVANPLETGPPL